MKTWDEVQREARLSGPRPDAVREDPAIEHRTLISKATDTVQDRLTSGVVDVRSAVMAAVIPIVTDWLKKQWEEHNSASKYSLRIAHNLNLYNSLTKWLADEQILIGANSRHIVLSSTSNEDRLTFTPHASGQGTITFDISGHLVTISGEVEMVAGLSIPSLILGVQTVEARDALIDFLLDLLKKEQAKDQFTLYVSLPRGGGFSHVAQLPKRKLSSVILPGNQLARIVDSVQAFYDNREAYGDRGMPHHHGLLFYGPPGTGKSTLPVALASHFDMTIYALSLADFETDGDLIRAIGEMGSYGNKRPMLLIEDVDVFRSTQRDSDTGKGVTLAGLLNALDGVATPSDLVTILTTNKVGELDPALIRPGRVDLAEEIGYITTEAFWRLYDLFYGEPPAGDWSGFAIAQGTTPAQISGVFKRNFFTPLDALNELMGNKLLLNPEILAETLASALALADARGTLTT